ncbi:MAG: hypothetical protein MAG581_00488 [Deltaproteobacteria bacterium]|jgi:alkylated DNA repair dioxygenase AlkB|nr:hypothetical protein [Deltaproteobacteria bacterium]
MISYDLFSYKSAETTNHTFIDMPDAEVYLYPSLFSYLEADELFDTLRENILWEKHKMQLYGEVHDVPRLTAWYGEPNKTYMYSGIKVCTNPWNANLLKIRERIEKISKIKFNSVLLNLYRSGSDSVSWHSDDEPELGINPVIGSLSLGETRVFQMKHRYNKNLRQKIMLQHGSYLLMKGKTQHQWLHQIPKSKSIKGERINLTFRVIK